MAAAAAVLPAGPNADDIARVTTVKACELLQYNKLAIFDESTQAAGWRKARVEFMGHVLSAGPDFMAALNYGGDIPPVNLAVYDALSITSNDAIGRPNLTMPQSRQQAMLALLRTAFQPGGECMRLTQHCVHCAAALLRG